MLWLLALSAALAGDGDFEASLHGDFKTFFFGTFPYDSALLPSDPFASAVFNNRLKFAADYKVARFTLHHSLTAQTFGTRGVPGFSSGVVTQVPEFVPLTYTVVDADDLFINGRIDRLRLDLTLGNVEVSIGRQPISFGTGLFFTPLDLVGPFNPSVIDQEYKPGYDAVRADVYFGMSYITFVGAYVGQRDLFDDWYYALDQQAYALYGQTTVGVTDLGLFLGEIYGDEVVGLSTTSSVGPVGMHGDAAVTFSHQRSDGTFFRGVGGADWRPTTKATLSGELYVQTLGAKDPSEYLSQALNPRYARGELWLLGRYYLGLAWSQEVTPLISTSLAGFSNLTDPSGYVAASFSWSVAGNASLVGGAFLGVGKRPEGLSVQSEFGLYPISAFLEMMAYF